MTDRQKSWTPERRAAARERILKNKPWEKATGPRTKKGKRRSSRNSFKHGLRSFEMKLIKRYLQKNSEFLNDLSLIQNLLKEHNDGKRSERMN